VRAGASLAATLLLLGLADVARAQEDEEALPGEEGLAGPVEAPEAPAEVAPLPLPKLLEDRWEWSSTGPALGSGYTDVAIGGDGTVAVAGSRGQVWLSADGGYSWREVLAPLTVGGSVDEDALLDVETRMIELMEEMGVDEGASLDAGGDAGTALVDALQADVQDGFAVRGGRVDPDVARRSARTRVWWAEDGRWVVGRADGLHVRATDGTWTRPVSEPVHAWFAAPFGELVGTDEGVIVLGRRSERWRGSPGGAPVWDFARAADDVIAVTQGGAFSSFDGVVWVPHGDVREPLACAEHDGADGVWMGGDATPLNTAEGDVAQIGVRDIARSEQRYVLATDVGVRASVDGGETWRSVAPSARQIDAVAVAWQGEVLLVASASGLFRLVEPELAAQGPPWIPLEALLGAAERRVGVGGTEDRLGLRGQALMWVLPEVQGRFVWQDDGGSQAGLDAGLEGSRGGGVGANVYLTWRPPSGLLTAADALVSADADGELQVYLGGADAWMGLGRTSRRAAIHRQEVAAEIVEVYRRRSDLVREQGTTRSGRTLLDEVNLALRVAEAEAWLDALTDGAVRRYPVDQGGGVR
jgi:hypothetical protein